MFHNKLFQIHSETYFRQPLVMFAVVLITDYRC